MVPLTQFLKDRETVFRAEEGGVCERGNRSSGREKKKGLGGIDIETWLSLPSKKIGLCDRACMSINGAHRH